MIPLARPSVSLRFIVVISAVLGLSGCGSGAPDADSAADLLLLNGRIVTLDDEAPVVSALAARDGRIVALGSDEELAVHRGPGTEVVDLDGRFAMPGFVEGHAHFTGLGRALRIVDLNGAATWDEVVARVAAAASDVPEGEWIEGRGWHQEKWERPPEPAVEGNPVHDALSAAVPDHPVALTHASGHAVMVNARAMELAGIDDDTPDPKGGTILRDASGRATGVLRETAESLIDRALGRAEAGMDPGRLEERRVHEIELADRECLSKGVTSFQDAGSSFETIETLRRLAAEGKLGVRLWMMLNDDNAVLAEKLPGYHVRRESDAHVTVGGIKRWLDGALGAHGAWLLEPYTDMPGSSGLNTYPLDDLETTAELAKEHDLQLCVHAIGDRGNRETLDVFERHLADEPLPGDRRWRIEHAQHLHPDDIPRFAELGVIASMQAVHCTSDGPWVPDRIGPQRAEQGAYVWRSLIDSGAVVSNGTDAPVEDVDPLASYVSAVTRRMNNGERFYPAQSMTRIEALRSYTIDAAYAAFEEDVKGSLELGKLADVVVLSEDLLQAEEEALRRARVEMTVVGGEILYRAD